MPKPTAKSTWFERADAIERLRVTHRETPYDDFAQQPLLPNKVSQLGPAIACADINNDGLDDFYLGGAAGHSGQFLISEAQGYRTENP